MPKAAPVERVCPSCGSTFLLAKPSRKNRFCSRPCSVRAGARTFTRRPVIDRLMDRISEDANGCWIWAGASHKGYGQIAISKEDGRRLTHRVTYEHFVAEIPEGLELDHLCHTSACCNPWHLEPVTHLVNVERAEATGRRVAAWHAKTHCRNGHEYTVQNTAVSPGGTRRCRACVAAWARAKRAAA